MKWFVFAVLLAAVVVTSPSISVGQQEETAETATASDGRLPPGYSEIVTNSQRRRIYQIQEQYQGQIDQLVRQIESIEAKRDAEVQAILDDQQRQVLQFILQIRERNRAEAEVASAAIDDRADSSDTDSGAQ